MILTYSDDKNARVDSPYSYVISSARGIDPGAMLVILDSIIVKSFSDQLWTDLGLLGANIAISANSIFIYVGLVQRSVFDSYIKVMHDGTFINIHTKFDVRLEVQIL